MTANLRANLQGVIDDLLRIREDLGAQLSDIYYVTRTWTGARIGEGDFADVEEKVFPTPQIKDFSHNIRITEASAIKQGDLMLVGVSMNQYPEESMLRTDTGETSVEKMLKIGKFYYRIISVKENVATWDLQVRKINQDEAEEA